MKKVKAREAKVDNFREAKVDNSRGGNLTQTIIFFFVCLIEILFGKTQVFNRFFCRGVENIALLQVTHNIDFLLLVAQYGMTIFAAGLVRRLHVNPALHWHRKDFFLHAQWLITVLTAGQVCGVDCEASVTLAHAFFAGCIRVVTESKLLALSSDFPP